MADDTTHWGPTRRALLGWSAGVGTLSTWGCSTLSTPADTMGAETKSELDEILSDLTDQSGRFQPISTEEKKARQQRCAEVLQKNHVDALLMEAGSTMDYLCDVSWGKSERLFALILLADGNAFWISPAFEAPRAQEYIEKGNGPVGELITWDEHQYAWSPLAEELRRRDVARIAIEPRARAFAAQMLAEEFGPERVVSGQGVVRDLRGKKDEHELALLRAVNELTQEAILKVSERLRPGMTDYDLGRWVRRAQERLGLRGVWVLPLLGETAAYPHGRPEGRSLTSGDLILVDTGGSLHGYQSDNTRTWIFDGQPTSEIERGWNAVRDAQRTAFDVMKPGLPCRAIDSAARNVLARAGYGRGYENFAHRLGHGIGMDGHEEPYLDGGNELLLEPGMTFSDEPGIYLPGKYGIRLEDIVVVTEDGADHFGEWQANPTSPSA
ncbi:MAG: hypothetical protein CMJ89_19835 [Planctomycetes bacterium]|nr:hypothetical protein [Planctomycetota bacterium]